MNDLTDPARPNRRRDEIVVTTGGISSEDAERVLAFVSHELRGPISAILGWTSMLLKNRLGEAQQQRALQLVERIAKLQQRLADDLTDAASIALGRFSLRLETVDDVAAVLADAVAACGPRADEKRVEVAMASPPRGIAVVGDPQRLHQAFCNLIDNAVKFTPAGGRVIVTCIGVGHEVEVRVEDKGRGIAARDRAQIFEPFWQGHDVASDHPSLGLGLAITRSIVDLHAGTIEALSRGVGTGTTFVVRLPVAESAKETARPALRAVPAFDPAAIEGGLAGRVLIVDDDPAVARAMQVLLETWGFDAKTVDTGTGAANALATGEFDVALCDLHLADGCGLQLMETVRRRGQRACPVIAMSGLGRRAEQQALDSGFATFLEKPIAESALLAAIQSCIGSERMPLGI